MINRLLKSRKAQESKWVEYGFRLMIITAGVGILVMVVNDLIRAKRTDQAADDKKYCLGRFDTVPCHQLRIEHLLLESRQKEINGG